MEHQHLAGSPAFALLHGQLSMVLAGCQQLPSSWQQQEEFKFLLHRALDMLQDPNSACSQVDFDNSADTSSDRAVGQRTTFADQDKRKQPQQPQKQQQQVYMSLDSTDTSAGDYDAAAAAGLAAEVAVLGSSSSSNSELLQALNNLTAAVQDEYAEVQEAETPVRSAVCAAGGINHLLRLITIADNNASHVPDSSSSSMEVAIAASSLLLALTECRAGSHCYCNNWAHSYIAESAVPALVRLLLFHGSLAKRAAELLSSLVRDADRHTEVAAAGGIAGLLHVLSDDVLAGNAGELLAGKPAALSRPYSVLAAAAAAVEGLITEGPVEVQVAIAEAGGVAVLERICEHLVRQKLSRRQRLGASKLQQRPCSVAVPA
jgi:hypothetical protein